MSELPRDLPGLKSKTAARIIGATFLLYIANKLLGTTVSRAASGSGTMAEKLESIGRNQGLMGLDAILSLVNGFSGIILAVFLYEWTRRQGAHLALIGLVCRGAEGLLGFPLRSLALRWLASDSANGMSAATREDFGELFTVLGSWKLLCASILFSAGSLAFCWLLFRSRSVPSALGASGVIASGILLVGLPLQLAGVIEGPAVVAMWIPMLFFEVPLGFWLLITGGRRQGPELDILPSAG